MVFIKDVSANADSGTATRWGGNDINVLDDYFDNVDISPKVAKINTRTYFRDDKFEWRNPGDTFSYIVSTGAITANRVVSLPVVSQDVTWAFMNIDNFFNALQTIRMNTEGNSNHDMFTLYRDTSTGGKTWELNFDAMDSGSAQSPYAAIRAKIITNTAGLEDGELQLRTTNGGTEASRVVIHTEGTVDMNSISSAGDNLTLNRATNSGGSVVRINFEMQDSGAANQVYGRINAEIIDNTAASEDGKLEFSTVGAGTLAETMILSNFGQLNIMSNNGEDTPLKMYKNSSSGSIKFFWDANDSAANTETYGVISAVIDDATNGSEDSHWTFETKAAGSFYTTLTFSSVAFTYKATAANLFNIFRDAATNGNGIELHFDAKDNAGNQTNYSMVVSETEDVVDGSEDGHLELWNTRAASVVENAEMLNNGVFKIGRDASNLRNVPSIQFQSGTTSSFNTTTAEQNLVSTTIKGSIMNSNGSLRCRISGNLLQNTVTATDWTLRIKFGGTTIYQDLVLSAYATQSANRMPYVLEFYIFNKNATNSQGMAGNWQLNDNGAPTTGTGDITDDEQQGNATLQLATDPAKDTTADQTLAVTMQMSNSNASIETRVEHVIVEIYPS